MMTRKTAKLGVGIFAAFSVTLLAASCASLSQPDTLSDDEQQKIVSLVQDKGADIPSPACNVEVFRAEGSDIYGWASCTDSESAASASNVKAEAFPFKISGDKVLKPDEGSDYQKDVHQLFPQELWNAVDQHSQGV
ncbi:hypothetical protein AUR04nite_21320 [Glutamicibacter uratoxydans]|uniref:Lipoprotein n=1 Tax=Glutamicibacter uratoxydans TaxID=43667 RepID=A0A4Y4DSX3_GLUUR|nr:hypothetical protein [Glutamicibacter uratoxydans]GED06600.1 hypothetical protein AUR04nite_21320 [Glutamicibacter uratoxydans]